MRKNIIACIEAIQAAKQHEKRHPSCALKLELKKAIMCDFEEVFSSMVDEGVIEIIGHTINKDEHLRINQSE